MKKKVLIMLAIFLVVILIIIVSLYVIDIRRMRNNEPVFFGTWGYTYEPALNVNREQVNEEGNKEVEQDSTKNILTEGYSDFEITVKRLENEIAIKEKILNNKELNADGTDYNLYYYCLKEVNVRVDNKVLTLEEALKSGKITLDGIIAKANNDLDNKIIEGDMCKDGGSMIYKYDTYTIIKNHTLEGNRDIYIGIPEMTFKTRDMM